MEIAFIGLGNMGSGMAANLVKSGHGIRAFDLSHEAVAHAVAAGAVAASNTSDACRNADAVVTMLPAAAHVLSVHDEVRKVATSSALLIDCSTIDVASARIAHEQARAAGFDMVDAPVSGGVAAASAGTLTFMVGGETAVFERAQPILSAMGKAVIHAGAAGAGQAAKICNNMLLAITMIGTCEAFALAEKLGLDDQVFFDIASKASGQNWSLTSYCPVPGPVPNSPANNGYKPGFVAGLMLKDLTLAMQAAQMASADTPLGAHAHALYEALCADGHAQEDFSVMMERIRGG
ncbi:MULTISPECIES: 3-hydroxyisobutyrate dehydrogenase [Asticcacaulis]|uniref:3-hydroxyisobutyrate dehydrogenase n=1 Tax=Asticcacaulis TaxID=76890 RepID=UPI001AE27F3A|nr:MULTISPECIES: 3-hydroxyisobutyrate dehydrogenase [Asticcacaulis]MBP2161535.1 3-hydroxyisobutyrate dehydrogenase [Asticcacaulis solisilvae]MDR6802614.1 3-hydroxyisobutyrate dehydrogenase [Asticcacaulis sp. BE141]